MRFSPDSDPYDPLAAALLSPFSRMTDMARVLFQHPRARDVFAERATLTENVVHALRLNAGHHPDDPQTRALVGELSRIVIRPTAQG